MELAIGERLRSAVCSTEVIVVRLPEDRVTLSCGGAEMLPYAETPPTDAPGPQPGFDGGSQLGKRYTSSAGAGLEILVTKPGAGSLADEAGPLVVKETKPLPSSD